MSLIAGLEYGMEQSLYTLTPWLPLFNLGRATYYDPRASFWVWLRETTSAAARAARLALSFVLGCLRMHRENLESKPGKLNVGIELWSGTLLKMRCYINT